MLAICSHKIQISRNKMEDRVKIYIKVLILCHLYKTISMVMSSLNDGPTQKVYSPQ